LVDFGRAAGPKPRIVVPLMSREAFKARTKAYALRVINLVDALPRDMVSKNLGQQLLWSGTSVAANYRAAVRGKSAADFVAKMGIVEEECDESLLWMELLIEAQRIKAERMAALMREGNEILAVTVASIKTARRGR
jgi:four helix bundle protein